MIIHDAFTDQKPNADDLGATRMIIRIKADDMSPMRMIIHDAFYRSEEKADDDSLKADDTLDEDQFEFELD